MVEIRSQGPTHAHAAVCYLRAKPIDQDLRTLGIGGGVHLTVAASHKGRRENRGQEHDGKPANQLRPST